MNAKTGEVSTFHSHSNVTLEEAVTASGAVPGIWPHIRLNNCDWIDGGMVSPTNAMLAKGAEQYYYFSADSRWFRYDARCI